MSYWIPTIILGLVVLVLVAQLPWHRPGAGQEEETRLDLGFREDWNPSSPQITQEQTEQEAVHS